MQATMPVTLETVTAWASLRAINQCECPTGKYSSSAGATSCSTITSGYYGVNSNGDAVATCAVGMDYGAACTSSADCTSSNTECITADGYCNCKAGYELVSQVCRPVSVATTRGPGEPRMRRPGCPRLLYSKRRLRRIDSAATAVTEAQVGKYTVDVNGYATTSGAVDAVSAAAGFYTTDASGYPVSIKAVAQKQARAGYYTVDSSNTATASGAVNEQVAAAGDYTLMPTTSPRARGP